MKVKTKFGVLVASMALFSGALVGCGSDPAPVPPAPSSYNVQCTKDDAKYTVNGLQAKYTAGATVAFTITENDPTNYKVTGVTSTQTTVTTVSALSYSFTMPETDVSLTVGTKAVDKYSVTVSTDDIIINEQVTFTLKLGIQEVVNFTISKPASETKDLEIAENKVTFKEEGDFVLSFKDDDRNAVAGDFTFHARARKHGESEDDPLTSVEAVSYGHELPICSGDSDPDIADKLSERYWIRGEVIRFDAEYDPQFSNLTVTLEGGLSLYRIGCKSPLDPATVKVGSVLTLEGQFYNYGRDGTEQANGKVQMYTKNSPKSQVRGIDNSVLKSISLDKGTLSLITNESEVVTATLNPDGGQTVLWKVDNDQVATVTPSDGNSLQCTVKGVGNGETDVYAYVGQVVSAACHVIVSDTKSVLRPLSASEILTHQSMKLGYEDAGTYHFSNGTPVTETVYYMNTTAVEGEAAKASVSVKDGKYAIKFGDYYVGYEWAKGTDGNFHHNLRTPTSVDDDLVAWFTLDADTLTFSFEGKDDAKTVLYLVKHASQQTIRLSEYNNTSVVRLLGWAPEAAVTSVSLEDAEVYVDSSVTPKCTINPFYATVSSMVFSTEDTTIVDLDAATGEVTGKGEGKATITVTVNGTVTDTCVVTVNAAPTGQVTATFDATEYAGDSSHGISANGDKISVGELAIDSVASFTVDGWKSGSGNTGKMYKGSSTNKWAIRLYKNENAGVTIKLPEGYTLVSAVINIRVQQGSSSSDLYNLGDDVTLTVENNQATYALTANSALYYVTVTYAVANA